MFENIAAIDIGTSSVKIVCIRTGFRDFNITTFAHENINHDIENPVDAVHDALSRIMEEVSLKGYTVLANLPMEKAIIRNIVFPFSDVSKIAEAIPYEAEENIPFKLDDIILDFQTLKSSETDKGRILLTAAHKEIIYDFLTPLSDHDIKPVKMGMESNAIFECYRYFNKIDDESIIQLDIGNNKTIINIVSNNSLLYTRSIFIGINLIQKAVSEILNIPFAEAVRTFEALNLDLTSLENNYQRGFYKNLKLTKTRFKKIFEEATDIVRELNEQIYLTIKAFSTDYGSLEFNRIILSGGGSNLQGIGSLISQAMEVPAVALPFLDEYRELEIRTQFPIALGTVLCYLSNRRGGINFLKGEFTPDVTGQTKKIYYLPAAFIGAAVIIFFINIIASMFIISRINESNRELLERRYNNYFGSPPPEDPVESARKKLQAEKNELKSIHEFMPEDASMMNLLRDMLVNFDTVENFELRNLVINENIVRFDGSSSDSSSIDRFREKLLATGNYDSVSLNIRSSTRQQILFTMSIRTKTGSEESR